MKSIMINFNRDNKIFYMVLLVLLISSNMVSAQNDNMSKLPPLIDRQLFFGDPEISYSQLSPDGKYISFLKQYNGVRNIYVKKRDEPFDKARPVTADDRPVPGYFWSRDSKYLLYVQDKGGNENFHVYAVDPSAAVDKTTGVPPALDLTPVDGIRAFIYAVPKNTPDQIIVGLNDRDPSYHDVYRIKLSTGDKELIYKNTEKLSGYEFDLEGNLRLATRSLDNGGSEILRVAGDKMTRIYSTTFEESASPYRFHKNGKQFYMVTNKGENVNLSRLVLFDPVTLEEKLVESDPENEVDFGGALFSQATDELIATYYIGDMRRTYPKDDKFNKDLDILKKKLPEGEINIQDMTEDMQYYIVVNYKDIDPGTVYLYDRKAKKLDLQYRSRPQLQPEHLAHMKPVRYTARDGLEIPAYLSLPRGVEPKNLPVIILPHGGPWARDNWGYDSYAQFLANRGYAVFQPNFRGSTGYGKKFLNAGNKEWGNGDMQHDITDGVKYLIDKGIANPEKVAIFGGSYGGYATLAGLAFTPELYACGVSYVGPSNLITLLNSIPPYWAPIRKLFHKRLGNPEDPEDYKQLIENSPLYSADQIKVPLMVIQGDNDPRVKTAESDQIVIALRDRGHDVVYLLAKDEGHGFRGEENRLAVAAAMEEFFAKYLNGRYQEDMSENISEKLAELSVDINDVSLPDTTMIKYAETAPLPKTMGNKVTSINLKYDVQMNIQGREINMELNRSVKKDQYDGEKAWTIVDVAKTPMGEASDTFTIQQNTLLPLKRSSVQGPSSLEFQYTPDLIKGEMKMGAQKLPVNKELVAPVFAEGPGLDVTLTTLAYNHNYKTTFRTFDPMQQKIKLMSLEVTGKETIDTDSEKYETWKIVTKELNGSAESTYYISVSEPYVIVKNIVNLPAEMGGGTMTSILNEVNKE